MKLIFLMMMMITPSVCFAMGESDSMRCKNGIASKGDTTAEVIAKCGQPESRRGSGTYRRAGRNYWGTEEWIYNFGPNEFIYVAVFDGSKALLFYSTREHGR